MKRKVVSATEFKAKCHAYLDEVNVGGGTITITKRGRPIAVLGAAKQEKWKSPRNSWAGRMRIVGDIVNTNFHWDCVDDSGNP